MCRLVAVLLLMFVALTACNSNTLTTSTAPTAATTVTETFSGTLTKNGAATHPFTVSGAGLLTATLTSVTPDSTIAIGLSLGTWNGSACQTVLANDKATQGTVIIGNASTVGNLCVRIYDASGSIVAPAGYQIDVVHP